MIPDGYIDIQAEKIRVYKELDSVDKDSGLAQIAARLEDRFGKLPVELERLFDIVRIRHRGEKLGFEKIIIKNGIMIAFFITNPMSAYYKSPVFSRILDMVSANSAIFELKQNNSKLRIISRKIDSLEKAYEVLGKLL